MVFCLLTLNAETWGDTNPGSTFRCIVDETDIADIISSGGIVCISVENSPAFVGRSSVLVPPWDRRAASTSARRLRFWVALDNVVWSLFVACKILGEFLIRFWAATPTSVIRLLSISSSASSLCEMKWWKHTVIQFFISLIHTHWLWILNVCFFPVCFTSWTERSHHTSI